MVNDRQIKLLKNYTPLSTVEGDEIYRNGIFHFNITRIYEHIQMGKLQVEQEQIHVQDWFKSHFHGAINEKHLPTVDVTKTIIQAEIRPGCLRLLMAIIG